jgi:hypothetical protein
VALPQVDRLREAELSRKHKAVAELKRMVAKAGQCSRLAARLATEYGEDSGRLLEAVLAKGAASTIECHLLRWRAMEKWAGGREQVYPLKACTACKYLMHKDDERCGPSVPEALKATALWVSRRLEMDIPDTDTSVQQHMAAMAATMSLCSTEHREHMWAKWSSLWYNLAPWPQELAARDGTTGGSDTDPERTYRELFSGTNPGFMKWLLCSATSGQLLAHHHAFLQYLHDALVIHDSVTRDHHPEIALAEQQAEAEWRQS